VKSLSTLILNLFGLLLAAVGFELGSVWPCHLGLLLGIVGIGISAFAAIRQYRESRPFVYEFSESSWEPSPSWKPPPPGAPSLNWDPKPSWDLSWSEEFVLNVPEKKHARGRNTVTNVYRSTQAGFEEVKCGQSVTSSGNILITAAFRFTGKLVIK
jgi:hypothetical protein